MSILVEHVSKHFGQHAALDDVTMDVKDGELVALLGPSGSGKTTLLRIMAGLEHPDPNPETTILLHGESVTDSRVGERQVGFVFQHYALFRHMTVFENVAFGLRVRPRRQRPSQAVIRDRVSKLLKLVHLESFSGRYPSQLSGGQRQRVALARALAIEPKVLLLDEPFGALDAKVRQGLREWLRRLHDEIHVTTVLVTHDQEEALEVADRVVIMNQARIEQVGTPHEVFHNPSSKFVLDFLGRVNVFHGRVEGNCAWINEVPLELPEPILGRATATSVYVRPHELEIHRNSNGTTGLAATVTRVNPAGSFARVGLAATDGVEIQVDLTLEKLEELQLEPGQSVFVTPKRARVFPPDYEI